VVALRLRAGRADEVDARQFRARLFWPKNPFP
jgi:hypothetical protein